IAGEIAEILPVVIRVGRVAALRDGRAERDKQLDSVRARLQVEEAESDSDRDQLDEPAAVMFVEKCEPVEDGVVQAREEVARAAVEDQREEPWEGAEVLREILCDPSVVRTCGEPGRKLPQAGHALDQRGLLEQLYQTAVVAVATVFERDLPKQTHAE